MTGELLTTAQVAKRLDCSLLGVQHIIKKGWLPAEVIGRNYVVRVKDVERYKHQPRGRPTQNGNKRKRRANGR